jgi:DNA-binding CsgD family transcriptional regulator
MARKRRTSETADAWSALSAYERRIGSLLADGCGDADIARRLLRSPQSVEWAVAKLCRKLDVTTRSELVAVLNHVGPRGARPLSGS